MDDCFSVKACKTTLLDVLGNDINPGGGHLQIVGVHADSGSASITADNKLRYTPESNDTHDTLTYTVKNAAGETDHATVSLSIHDSLNLDHHRHGSSCQSNDSCASVQHLAKEMLTDGLDSLLKSALPIQNSMAAQSSTTTTVTASVTASATAEAMVQHEVNHVMQQITQAMNANMPCH
ncbi:MAG: Ig-like domain-containing protein [Burkholderiaceae bacterium]